MSFRPQGDCGVATPPPCDRIMWVTPTRIAYRSLFGRPGIRTFGAWIFYVALEQPFEISIDGAPLESHWIALVPPYVPHRVVTSDGSLAQVLLEAETLAAGDDLAALTGSAAQAAKLRRQILAGFARPLADPADFDLQFLGQPVAERCLDPRIAQAIEWLSTAADARVTAEECAARLGVSFSRFTHLFTSESGTTFRRLRAWKRARSLLPLVGSRSSLVDVALDTGYADSTHFSHAIRQFYGYKPSDIFAGSRRLAVVSDWSRAAMV